MSLDDKLEDVLKPFMEDGVSDLRELEVEAVSRIKQAFADEGYVKIPTASMTKEGWIEVSTDRGVRYKGAPLLLGQEWYDNFRKEYDKVPRYEFDMDDVWDAARRAAGIDNG